MTSTLLPNIAIFQDNAPRHSQKGSVMVQGISFQGTSSLASTIARSH